MPFALYQEISTSWGLGPSLCNLWVSFDVTCCTASILNLCTISVDRYLTITRPLTYGVNATAKRSYCFIVSIWLASCLISVPPLLVFGNEHGTDDLPGCQVSQNVIYQLYATLAAFYIPLSVMIVMYYKIYGAAKKVVEAELKAQPSSTGSAVKCSQTSRRLLPRSSASASAGAAFRIHGSTGTSGIGGTTVTGTDVSNSIIGTGTVTSTATTAAVAASSDTVGARGLSFVPASATIHSSQVTSSNYSPGASCDRSFPGVPSFPAENHAIRVRVEFDRRSLTLTNNGSEKKDAVKCTSASVSPSASAAAVAVAAAAAASYERSSSSDLRERKASVTLGVIMTAFTVCWLPFFILALLRPFSTSASRIPGWIVSFALWLGYANSMINPIIYVTFHQDFRKAFRYLLCLQCATMGTRLREEAYQSQYGCTSYSHQSHCLSSGVHLSNTASGKSNVKCNVKKNVKSNSATSMTTTTRTSRVSTTATTTATTTTAMTIVPASVSSSCSTASASPANTRRTTTGSVVETTVQAKDTFANTFSP